MGKFYDQQSFMDVTFQLADSSTVAANELLLAITSPVFEAIFFIHLADRNLREVRVEDVRFDTGIKTVFMNSLIKNTSKLIQSDQWSSVDEVAIKRIFDEEFLAATEGELYMDAKQWCLCNTSSKVDALKMFLEKFVHWIIPEYMSQRDFLSFVADGAFLAQVDVLRDWTIKIMVRNAADNTIRGFLQVRRVFRLTTEKLIF